MEPLSVASTRETRTRKRQVEESTPPTSTPTQGKSKENKKSEEKLEEAVKEKKKTLKEKEPELPPKLPPRKKMLVKKSQPKPLPTNTKYYPYMSVEAKASFSDFIQRKQVIKERALAWNEKDRDADIKSIIESLG